MKTYFPSTRNCVIEGCTESVGRHGAKDMCYDHYNNQTRRGNPLSWPTRRNGSGWFVTGYKGFTKNYIKKLEHVEKAEKALGRDLPDGAVVHHADLTRANNETSNLVICPSQAYHLLLHIRTRAFDACGNASWRKCKVCKTHDDPKNLQFWGREVMHLVCSAKKQRDRIARMKGA